MPRRPVLAAVLAAALLLAAGGAAVLVAGRGGGSGSHRRVAVPAGLEALAGGSGDGRNRAGGAGGPRASALVRVAQSLPLERQVAQLFLVGTDARFPRDAFLTGSMRAHDWGGVVLDRGNWVDRQQLSALAGEVGVVARSAGHLAPLVAADQGGGAGNAFPGLPPRAPSDQAAGGAGAAASEARAAARELHALHVSMTLAPSADVGTAGGGVESSVFADDPATVAALARSAVDAYRAGSLIAAVGHFPGQGAASQDPNEGTATVGLGLDDLRRRDLVPFRAVAPDAPVVAMSNAVYVAFDGVAPAGLLPDAVALLRREVGFRGVVMTDDLAAAAPVTGEGAGRTAVDALRAGADLLYLSGGPAEEEQAYQAVLAAVRSGRLSRARVETALLRDLALKRRYGVLTGSAR